MIVMILIFALAGIAAQGFGGSVEGFLRLQRNPARLITDFTVSGGVGGALLNAAVVGAIGLAFVTIAGIKLSGPSIAAVYTMMGFALFGKTPVNILPIIAGVYLAGRIVGKAFNAYILIALFGTALGPLVTFIVFEAGFTGVPALLMGLFVGVAAGVCLPPVAMAMLHMHQGYNLYNLGLSCGFFGLFGASLLVAAGKDVSITIVWNTRPSLVMILLVPLVSVLYILWGFALGRGETVEDVKDILKLPGRLPSDFVDLVSPGGALVNVGVLGLLGSAYVFAVGADFNGPVLGGLLTLMGFGAFGKHPKNCWPVLAGVILSCLVFGKSLTAPGPILAALFATTLAPLAGQFGPLAGILAGFIHMSVVDRSAAWHGGLDLYNNGFAGGLTATLIVAIIEWYKAARKV